MLNVSHEGKSDRTYTEEKKKEKSGKKKIYKKTTSVQFLI